MRDEPDDPVRFSNHEIFVNNFGYLRMNPVNLSQVVRAGAPEPKSDFRSKKSELSEAWF